MVSREQEPRAVDLDRLGSFLMLGGETTGFAISVSAAGEETCAYLRVATLRDRGEGYGESPGSWMGQGD